MSTKSTWYAIRRKTAMAAAVAGAVAAAEIYIYGDIGESWYQETVSAANFVRELNELEVDAITVRISSIGGSVPDGLAIFNAMRRHKATITVEVDSMAFSIASLIAMAGDKVHMAANAMLMIHAPWTYAAGNSAELRELADQLDTWASGMSTSYAFRTGDQPAMLALLTDGKDHYFTAEQALENKFIDAITDAIPVAASAARSMPLNRYRSLPAAFQAASTHAAAAAIPQEPSMPQTNSAAAQPGTAPATQPTTDVSAVLAQDQTRREAIRAVFKPFTQTEGVSALLTACEDDPVCTPEAAGSRLLAQIGRGMSPAVNSQVETVEDETDKFRDAAVTALLSRAGIVTAKGAVRADGSNPYRGHTLSELARACLARGNIKSAHLDRMAVVGQAFTQGTSDFPILLEQAMHKALQAAYAIQPDTWQRFCGRGTVSDFRAHNRYRVGSLGNLDKLGELGEFKSKTIPDGERASVIADTKGNIITISRKAIVNDDLGAFIGLAAAMGRAAKRTIEADVYAALASNGGMGPLLADNLPIFHASHSNLIASGGTAGVPSVAVFDAMRILLGSQKDVGGNDFLQLLPAVWLGPIGLGGAARVVVNSTFDPDSNNKLQRANIAHGVVQDIVDTPRLSGTAHYMFADPSVAPVMEVSFLDGNDMPFLDRQEGWSVDGSAHKVRLDYGVSGIDYRGGVLNDGTP